MSRLRHILLPATAPLAAILLAVALLLHAGFAHAATADASSQPVVIGGDRSYPPYEFLDRDGKPAGYNVELSRAIAEVMGMQIEFRLGSWSDARDALRDGRVDVLQGISFSQERSREIDFSIPHAVINHAVFARRGAPPISSLDDLAGKEVALHRGGIMHDQLVHSGFRGTMRLTDTPADALRLAASGRCDYALVAILPGMYLIRQLKLTNLTPMVRNIAAQKYCYGVLKGRSELLSRFNEGLAILKQTGQYDAIQAKWLGVLEPKTTDWRTVAKYAAVVVVPLLILLGAIALWTRTLHRQVALRTADLTREVAERRRAEEDLRVNQQQLVQADKMAALGVLVSGVAHEINNPTGLILLETPKLKRFFADASRILERYYEENGDFRCGGIPYSRMREIVPESLDKLQESGKRIKRIVSDLKDFARHDDRAGEELVDLNEAAGAAVRLVEHEIRKATTAFTARYGERLPRFRGSTQRIEQVIVNLILNACQALPAPDRAIELTTRYDQGVGVTLTLRDEGNGVAPENLSRLTDPFFTTKREWGGTGLGLSVSAGIVKEHGGTLSFKSTPGSGTTVAMIIPAFREEEL
ncbi:transporter substrate-binding domain-containing protein [Geomonas sp. RF6]|uniref:transporter substrate-binding domain-containing protein n=1 Tax=Geomonas sp. RF6 TaxID=2897342 RepID=UPI001E652359|nr:transporter substrate-binding domain-containing protein [Geomonas sp. RF6]UFS69026.1 transporter substrate-binding domain-containing protein [Geomonas sp. RF6]